MRAYFTACGAYFGILLFNSQSQSGSGLQSLLRILGMSMASSSKK
jgi:hypothetical protein